MKNLATFVLLFFALAGTTAQGTAFLGINFDQLSPAKARALGFDNLHGSYVTGIIDNTTADRAGLQPFDYVFGLDDKRTGPGRPFGELLDDYRTGDRATLHYRRWGEDRTVKITFLARPPSAPDGKSDRGFLGVTPHSDNDDGRLGVRVNIIENSTAAELGLQDGDLITAIDSFPMVDWQDISTAVAMLSTGDLVSVKYRRNGSESRAAGTIKSYRETRIITGRLSEWRQGERAFLGIRSTDVSREKAERLGFPNPYGSYITAVLGNTAAERAGLQPLDYVYGIDEYRTGVEQNLSQILSHYEPGDEADVHYIRRKEANRQRVTFGSRSDADRESSYRSDDCETDPFLGVRQPRDKRTEEGIPVNIVKNSTAEAIGMKDGDVITTINGYTMYDWDDIRYAVNSLRVGDPIEVGYLRNSIKQKGKAPIQSYCDTEMEKFEIPEININIPPFSGRERERDNLHSAQIKISALSEAEARQMNAQHDVALSTANNLDLRAFKLLPNKELLRMQFVLPDRGDTRIRVFNEAGRLIYEYDLGAFQGEFSDDLDIAQNGEGDYYLEIRQSNRYAAKKITISGL